MKSPRDKREAAVNFSLVASSEGRNSTVKLRLAEARMKDIIDDRYGWRAEDDGNDAKYSPAKLGISCKPSRATDDAKVWPGKVSI